MHDNSPDLDIAYKLAEYAGQGRLKLSSGKPILPGRKQVFREERDGVFAGDTIGRFNEDLPGRPLLSQVMQQGRRCPDHETDLDALRSHAQSQIERLPPAIRAIETAEPGYPVTVSRVLERYQAAVRDTVAGSHTGHRADFRTEEIQEWRWVLYPWAVVEDVGQFIREMKPVPEDREEIRRRLKEQYGLDPSTAELDRVLRYGESWR